MSKRILVVGGAGFIGAHTNQLLYQSGYETVVYDNLSRGDPRTVLHGTFVQGDIGDAAALNRLFQTYSFDAVMHFAALIQVGESVQHPFLYYKNNVCKTLTLLEIMRKYHVPLFIFSSSSAIFGYPQTEKVNELHPCMPISPYGETKWMVEKILRDYDRAYGLRSCCLRYFNAAGGDPEGKIHNYTKTEQNLIPIALKSLKYGNGAVTLFGDDYDTPDGTCIRDYIHVMDLAAAHLLALERLLEGNPSCQYNLGNGEGYSVKEVLDVAEKVTGQKIQRIYGPRRAGDAPRLLADATKAQQELGWRPHFPAIETIVTHAWQAM